MSEIEENEKKEKQPKPKYVVRTPTDVQRIRLQKLMDNPVIFNVVAIYL